MAGGECRKKGNSKVELDTLVTKELRKGYGLFLGEGHSSPSEFIERNGTVPN